MSLIISGPSWRACSTNLAATPVLDPGTAITPGTSNADGTAVSLIANLAHDCEYLVIGFYGFFLAGTNGSALVDILTDPAGGSSWGGAPLINDLLAGCSATSAATVGPGHWYHFPLFVPAGTSLGAQARCAHTVAPGFARIICFAYGGNRNPGSWWCGKSVESIGINAASSQGTNHTGGNGSYSSWTDFGSPITGPAGAVQWGIHGTNTDTTTNTDIYHFEFGVGSQRIGPTMTKNTGTNENGCTMQTGPIFYQIPDATQLQVRANCRGTAETIDVAAYVVH